MKHAPPKASFKKVYSQNCDSTTWKELESPFQWPHFYTHLFLLFACCFHPPLLRNSIICNRTTYQEDTFQTVSNDLFWSQSNSWTGQITAGTAVKRHKDQWKHTHNWRSMHRRKQSRSCKGTRICCVAPLCLYPLYLYIPYITVEECNSCVDILALVQLLLFRLKSQVTLQSVSSQTLPKQILYN